MRLYNTLSRKVETLKPLKRGQIKLYTCGPTVYHYMHIGNLRKAIFDDLLKRTLLAEGYKVKHIMNITDVGHLVSDADVGEDKLEKEARIEKKSVWEIAEYYTQHALADYASVNVLNPSKTIKATDCIKQEVEFIKELERKGFAYKGILAVYFNISKLEDYGKLSGQKLTDKEIAVREGLVTDDSKKHPGDFALWIFTKEKHQDHAMRWSSPWGEGFPGWHIECSAIIKKELGDSIDIHTGGVDHIGTHHTNEIAQSEALIGQPLASIWMHSEFLQVEGEKMSKSRGNIYRIVDLEDHGFNRLAYRLLILSSHYRSQQNFTWQALKSAESRLKSLQAAADTRFQPIDNLASHDFNKARESVLEALSDDLNSPEAIAAANSFLDVISEQGVNKADSRKLVTFLKWLDNLLGLELSKSKDISGSEKKLIKKREEARSIKDWAKSDQIRDELAAAGIGLRDTDSGTLWYRI